MQQDLEHLLGPDWHSQVPQSPAAQRYVQHLQELSERDPVMLLPYVFSMHIPILLGFLGTRIQKTLQLPDKQGVAFFWVEGKADKLAELRKAVSQAGKVIAPEKQQALVQEAVVQFRHNNAVVAGFRLGWRAVLHALRRLLAAVPSYAVVLLMSLLVLWCLIACDGSAAATAATGAAAAANA